MAHADYNCCAICDNKQDYSNDASTKEEICVECLKKIRGSGVNALDTTEFMKWARRVTPQALEEKLKEIGYTKCCYGNDFDEKIKLLTPNPQN